MISITEKDGSRQAAICANMCALLKILASYFKRRNAPYWFLMLTFPSGTKRTESDKRPLRARSGHIRLVHFILYVPAIQRMAAADSLSLIPVLVRRFPRLPTEHQADRGSGHPGLHDVETINFRGQKDAAR